MAGIARMLLLLCVASCGEIADESHERLFDDELGANVPATCDVAVAHVSEWFVPMWPETFQLEDWMVVVNQGDQSIDLSLRSVLLEGMTVGAEIDVVSLRSESRRLGPQAIWGDLDKASRLVLGLTAPGWAEQHDRTLAMTVQSHGTRPVSAELHYTLYPHSFYLGVRFVPIEHIDEPIPTRGRIVCANTNALLAIHANPRLYNRDMRPNRRLYDSVN